MLKAPIVLAFSSRTLLSRISNIDVEKPSYKHTIREFSEFAMLGSGRNYHFGKYVNRDPR